MTTRFPVFIYLFILLRITITANSLIAGNVRKWLQFWELDINCGQSFSSMSRGLKHTLSKGDCAVRDFFIKVQQESPMEPSTNWNSQPEPVNIWTCFGFFVFPILHLWWQENFLTLWGSFLQLFQHPQQKIFEHLWLKMWACLWDNFLTSETVKITKTTTFDSWKNCVCSSKKTSIKLLEFQKSSTESVEAHF